MSDMLDVIHFFIEEDSTSMSTAEQVEAKNAVRTGLYRSMYDMEYKYASPKTGTELNDFDAPFDENDDMPTPIDPFARSNTVKPYVPATDFDPDSTKPFGRVLDAPLG